MSRDPERRELERREREAGSNGGLLDSLTNATSGAGSEALAAISNIGGGGTGGTVGRLVSAVSGKGGGFAPKVITSVTKHGIAGIERVEPIEGVERGYRAVAQDANGLESIRTILDLDPREYDVTVTREEGAGVVEFVQAPEPEPESDSEHVEATAPVKKSQTVEPRPRRAEPRRSEGSRRPARGTRPLDTVETDGARAVRSPTDHAKDEAETARMEAEAEKARAEAEAARAEAEAAKARAEAEKVRAQAEAEAIAGGDAATTPELDVGPVSEQGRRVAEETGTSTTRPVEDTDRAAPAESGADPNGTPTVQAERADSEPAAEAVREPSPTANAGAAFSASASVTEGIQQAGTDGEGEKRSVDGDSSAPTRAPASAGAASVGADVPTDADATTDDAQAGHTDDGIAEWGSTGFGSSEAEPSAADTSDERVFDGPVAGGSPPETAVEAEAGDETGDAERGEFGGFVSAEPLGDADEERATSGADGVEPDSGESDEDTSTSGWWTSPAEADPEEGDGPGGADEFTDGGVAGREPAADDAVPDDAAATDGEAAEDTMDGDATSGDEADDDAASGDETGDSLLDASVSLDPGPSAPGEADAESLGAVTDGGTAEDEAESTDTDGWSDVETGGFEF